MAFQFPSMGVSPAMQQSIQTPLQGLSPSNFQWGNPQGGMDFGAAGASGGGLFDGMSGFDGLKLGVAGLGTLGSLWSSFQANKLAKEQFKFTKDFAQKNLANQIASYNTALEDRSRSRAVVEGQSAETAKSYVDTNRLKG